METVIFLIIAVGLVAGIILATKIKFQDTSMDSSIADKIKELPKVFESAKTSINIATDFDKGFFTNSKVKKALENAVNNGVMVRILTEGNPTDWFKRKENLANMTIKKVKELPRHLMVIDSRHFRLEAKHELGRFGKLSSSGKSQDKAMLFLDFPIAGKRYDKEFDRLWTRSP